jgi:hypothetical protein
MLSTAMALQEVTSNAVTDYSTMERARDIFLGRESMTDDEFARAIFQYSAHLSSLTATLVTSVCLSKDQINEMVETLKEFDSLSKEME